MELLTGMVFGFLGSLHCIGMCGPLALAIPVGSAGWTRFVTGRVVYNLGRVVTYSVLGLFVGSFGEAVIAPAFQQDVSIVGGVMILFGVIFPRLVRRSDSGSGWYARFTIRIKNVMGRLLRATTMRSLFGLGLINGLLPCGFVYLAVAGAIATGSGAGGALFMAGFGSGTIPAMLGVSLFPHLLSSRARLTFGKLLPILTVLVGVLLIVRGLNLGIPYLSPKVVEATQEVDCCH